MAGKERLHRMSERSQIIEADLKESIKQEIDLLIDEMVKIAKAIYSKPEIGYREYESARLLTDFLERNGFEVTTNIAGMETAFMASYPKDAAKNAKGPTVALLAEYDALPGLGHACGHNLIGTASAGAAVGLSRAISVLKGRVVVLGCPAEEAGVDGAGGKVRLVEAGVFDQIDAAMIFHPTPMTTVGGETSALSGLEFEFYGKAAHAAGNPWDGINALDGVLQTFNAINALRQSIRDDVRIHGIVTHGGDAPNIIPEHASARFFVRALTSESLKDTVSRVENCAKGAAVSTGARLEIKRFNNFYDSMKTNSVLAGILKKNLEDMGLKIEAEKKGKGSTDFGNVTRVVPGCELGIHLGDGAIPHTRKFLEASGSDEGCRVMDIAAKILAMSTIDLLENPDLIKKAGEEFKRSK